MARECAPLPEEYVATLVVCVLAQPFEFSPLSAKLAHATGHVPPLTAYFLIRITPTATDRRSRSGSFKRAFSAAAFVLNGFDRVNQDSTVVESELSGRDSVSLNVDSMSNHAKTVLLANLASTLTICARGIYEVGTDRVVQPELLRAYNELLHRVTGAARDHLLGSKGYSLQDILEMLRGFGDKNGRTGEMKWALEQAAKSL